MLHQNKQAAYDDIRVGYYGLLFLCVCSRRDHIDSVLDIKNADFRVLSWIVFGFAILGFKFQVHVDLCVVSGCGR